MDTKRFEDMKIPQGLTFLQRVALEGEVCSCFENAMHEADQKYLTYVLLMCNPTEYHSFFKEEILKYMEEEDFTKVYAYVVNNIFPTSLYINKLLSDIKGYTNALQGCTKDKFPKLPKQIVKSKFLTFIREVKDLAPVLCKEIIQAILTEEDGSLDFLKDLAFSLKIDIVGNTDHISKPINMIKLVQTPLASVNMTFFSQEVDRIKTDFSDVVKSNLEKVLKAEREEKQVEQAEAPRETKVFRVNKIDKSTKAIVFSKEFSTQVQALEYVRKISRDYPDILQRYDFEIQM